MVLSRTSFPRFILIHVQLDISINLVNFKLIVLFLSFGRQPGSFVEESSFCRLEVQVLQLSFYSFQHFVHLHFLFVVLNVDEYEQLMVFIVQLKVARNIV